jgi:hypothetical protein
MNIDCVPNLLTTFLGNTFYPIYFAQSHFVNYIGDPKEKITLCLLWECQKFF